MKFLIVTHTPHIFENNSIYAYAPYIREMNIWEKNVEKLIVVAPMCNGKITDIHLPYKNHNVKFINIPSISLTSGFQIIRTLIVTPVVLFQIFRGMLLSDHIHLRCPGNIGLIGCVVQVLFPKRSKTAKYAGNWDPKAKQPKSYRIQKWLLGNTNWTKNMQALVYGEWPDQSKNIKPFFTATYAQSKIADVRQRFFSSPFKFLFVGTLSPGKRPLYCVKIVEALLNKGMEVSLDLYGEGTEREALEVYVRDNELNDTVVLHGNQSANIVEMAYKQSDFILLPSRSEGWPKAVAEAMFWGCVPLVTKVSCVPWMLGDGKRGILLEADLNKDMAQIRTIIADRNKLEDMSEDAQIWSHQYTLDYFEAEIKMLLS
jgi:glycosyltransferase involved in cell wall biosynthesis